MRRVVVTGVGAVSPCGPDLRSSWSALIEGKSGVGPITRFDASAYTSRIAGEVKGFDPAVWMDRKKVRDCDTFIHYAIASARMALEQAGFTPSDELKDRTATIIGVGLGGMGEIESTALTLAAKGPRRVSPHFIPAVIPNLAAGQVSMIFGLRGPSYAPASACASGAHAIGEAFRLIRWGYADAAVAGGSESTITGLAVGGFAQMRALSTRNDAPEQASRPFDQGRDGFIIAEGAGVLLLEEREAALGRGARILAELIGYGASSDAYHLTQPAPDGEGAQRAMRAALAEAQIPPEQVDYINAHGTSTETGDLNELRAIQKVFGAHAMGGVTISSTKSMTGHLLGAAGGFESVVAVLSIAEGVIPPTINLTEPMPESAGMDLAPNQAKRKPVHVALNNSFGFGGMNASLVFRQA